jgi:8-oxo-dGTP pyrophosphatase MutT (NUDIX family)
VTIEHVGGAWLPNASYEDSVAGTWKQKQQEAERASVRIWDGLYYRVTNAEALEKGNGLIHFALGTISYRYLATYRQLHAQHASHALDPLYHLSTAALIRTSDNWYVFGRRSRNGSIDLIGGGVQQDELEVTTGADLERNLVKEIREELGISHTDLSAVLGLGIVLSSTSNVLVLAQVDLKTTKREVELGFDRREEDEMAEPVFVSHDEIRSFLRSLADYRALMPGLIDGVAA